MANKILITGGAGFIGSHVAEFYAAQGWDVVILDNLSRSQLLATCNKTANNWDYLGRYPNIRRIKGDIRDKDTVKSAIEGIDVVVHTAAQTAVTTSMIDPETDFSVNVTGTFNLLEAIRKSGRKVTIIYCSTNKVYGENVNKLKVEEESRRYRFGDEYRRGVSESLSIDLCEHTPYGCSKLTGDLYMQDFASLYGLKIGIFRMSCIYGIRQFGAEDQGWVAWFTIATLLGKPITICGDGKQVRDILYVDDLIKAYDAFIRSDLPYGIFNMGGGSGNTISLLELLDMLEGYTGLRSPLKFDKWRPSDQKVYISDISKAQQTLAWKPQVSPSEGIGKLVKWVEENKGIFG